MESLDVLKEAIKHTIGQLETPCGKVRIEPELGAVVVDDVTDDTMARAALVAALKRSRLDVQVHATHPLFRIRVFAQR